MAKKRANGEGSIRKRSDGRWEGRYTAGYDPETGKRITKNVLAKTQAEVKEKLAKAIEESKKLDIVRSDEYIVAEWLRLWYELYAKPNIRPTTADNYHRSIESHVIPRIGEIKLKQITSRDIQKMYKDLQENERLRKSKKQKNGLSNATVRGIHMMLHNALDRAVRERLILRNPTEDCIIPKIQKQEMKILHPEDMKAYLEGKPALPTAYFADNDVIALGAMRALEEKGIKIPDQISIVGFDDIRFGAVSTPGLTTIHVHKQEMGEVAVRRALDHIRYSGRQVKMKIQVGTDFLVRGSVRNLDIEEAKRKEGMAEVKWQL